MTVKGGIETNGRVSIAIIYPRSNTEHRKYAQLEIRDYASGQAIAYIEMTSEQVVDLITSHYQSIDAWVCPPKLRHRIGRNILTKVVEVPREIMSMTMSQEARPERYAKAEEWARGIALEGSWEDWSLRRTNHNWECILHSWEEAPDVEG